MPACEFDGTPLSFDPEGREEACPECEREGEAHIARCRPCRMTANMPDIMSLDTLLLALQRGA